MTKFFTDYGVVVALGCAGAAVLYGLFTSRWLLSKSPGNERMQEISKAVQEGASAYLKRQYTIIGAVAVVLAVVIAIALDVRTAKVPMIEAMIDTPPITSGYTATASSSLNARTPSSMTATAVTA